MMFGKKTILSISVFSFFVMASNTALSDNTMDITSQLNTGPSNGDMEADRSLEFKDRMKELRERELILQQENRIEQLEAQIKESQGRGDDGDDYEEMAQRMSQQISNMESEISQLRNQNRQLSSQLASARSAQTLDNIENHIFVTRIDQFGQNKKAEIFYDFHYGDYSEGEEITEGVVLSGIESKFVEITKNNGETHKIRRTSIDRAVQEALMAREPSPQQGQQQGPPEDNGETQEPQPQNNSNDVWGDDESDSTGNENMMGIPGEEVPPPGNFPQ